VAVIDTTKLPDVEYAFLGFASVDVVPSPKLHTYDEAFFELLVN